MNKKLGIEIDKEASCKDWLVDKSHTLYISNSNNFASSLDVVLKTKMSPARFDCNSDDGKVFMGYTITPSSINYCANVMLIGNGDVLNVAWSEDVTHEQFMKYSMDGMKKIKALSNKVSLKSKVSKL